jgi:ParB-like chromosome segregation protein Spo0J
LPSLLTDNADAEILSAYRRWGYTLGELAEYLGVHESTVAARIARSGSTPHSSAPTPGDSLIGSDPSSDPRGRG